MHTHAGEDADSPAHSHEAESDDPLDKDAHASPRDSEEGHTHTHTNPHTLAHSSDTSRRLLHSDGDEHSTVDCIPVERNSSMIGLALVTGFVLMLIVDRVSGGHSHAHGEGGGGKTSKRRTEDVKIEVKTAASNLSSPNNVVSGPSTSPLPPSARSASAPSLTSQSSIPSLIPATPHSNTALLGILTHSAIDGLALGAISVSENAALELVVFLAIILPQGARGVRSGVVPAVSGEDEGGGEVVADGLLSSSARHQPRHFPPLLAGGDDTQGEGSGRGGGGRAGDGAAGSVSALQCGHLPVHHRGAHPAGDQ